MSAERIPAVHPGEILLEEFMKPMGISRNALASAERMYRMPVGLIVSLGGSLEPIVKTIVEHRPSAVCYFASQQSVIALGSLHTMVSEQLNPLPEFHTVLVDNVNNLVHCFDRALECARYFQKKEVLAKYCWKQGRHGASRRLGDDSCKLKPFAV